MRGALLAARWARAAPPHRRRAGVAVMAGDTPVRACGGGGEGVSACLEWAGRQTPNQNVPPPPFSPPQPQTAVVRSVDGAPSLTITLSLAGRTRHLSRPRSEPLAKCLDRVARSAAPPAAKKRGAAAVGAPPPQSATLFADAGRRVPVPGTTPNGDAWTAGGLLEVGGAAYRVVVNPPAVVCAALSGAPLAGCPLAPALDLAFAEREACRYQWQRRQEAEGGPPAASAATGTPLAPPRALGAAGWEAVPAGDGNGGTGPSYTPTQDDIGWTLRVVVTPGSVVGGGDAGPWFGDPAVALAPGPTEAGPPSRASDGRADLVPTPTTPPRLRVVTYNLLADQYAATDKAKDVLFSHCPPHHLDPAYRRSLAAAELTAYAADIICLQEVDERAFEGVLSPVLSAAGFTGRYTNKASSVREGAALFWREARFECVDWRDVVLKDVFAAVLREGEGGGEGGDGDDTQPSSSLSLAARHGRLLPMLRSSAWLRDALAKVSTVAQVGLLVPRARAVAPAVPDSPLLVTNTHLFFHPGAPHIRTLHVVAALTEAADVANRARVRGVMTTPPAPLFCGDLNSDLNDGVPGTIELLREGTLSSGFWDWGLGACFRYDDDGVVDAEPGTPLSPPDPTTAPRDGLTPIDITIPFHLAPSDGLATPYTNHVRGYAGLLDYVWTDERVLRPIGGPPPPLDRVRGEDYIPNAVFPSDHVAVIADLEWRPVADREAVWGAGGGASATPRGCPPSPFVPLRLGGPPAPTLPAGDAALPPALLALRSGALLLLPTDTLYGVGADACCPSAVKAMYTAKGRDGHVPLAISVADVADVGRYGDVSGLPAGLLDALLPGAVTVLLTRRSDAPLCAALNPGVATVGVRVPAAPWIRALARAHGGAIALTSANESGCPPARTVDEAAAIVDAVSIVVDAGTLGAGRAGSTVVDLSAVTGTTPPHNAYAVLREGEGVEGVRAVLRECGLVEAV